MSANQSPKAIPEVFWIIFTAIIIGIARFIAAIAELILELLRRVVTLVALGTAAKLSNSYLIIAAYWVCYVALTIWLLVKISDLKWGWEGHLTKGTLSTWKMILFVVTIALSGAFGTFTNYAVGVIVDELVKTTPQAAHVSK